MPSPTCFQCNCTESFLWKPAGENQHLCNDCFIKNSKNVKKELDTMTTATTIATASRPDERKARLRKSTRSTRYSGKNGNVPSTATGNNGSGTTNAGSTKAAGSKSGRGRRSLFRRPPMKAPTISATTTYVKSIFYKVMPLADFQSSRCSIFTLIFFFASCRARTFKLETSFRCAIPIMIHSMHKYVV